MIVASVSCIYGLGSPEAYYGMLLMLEKGQKISRNQIVSRSWWRSSTSATTPISGAARSACAATSSRSIPTYDDYAYRIELWGDEVESLSQIDPLLGQVKQTYTRLPIYPKTHYVMSRGDQA